MQPPAYTTHYSHNDMSKIDIRFQHFMKIKSKDTYFRDWILVQQRIREHPDFDRWFVEYPEVGNIRISLLNMK